MDAISKHLPEVLRSQCAGAYLVGGAVRDLLLGSPPKDLDIAVLADPAGWAERLAERVGGRSIRLGKDPFAFHRVVAGPFCFDVCPVRGDAIESDLRARDFTINAMAWDLQGARMIDPTGGFGDLTDGRLRMVSRDGLAQDPIRLLRVFRLSAVLGMTIDPATLSAVESLSGLVRHSAGERVRAELLAMMDAADSSSQVEAMAATGLLGALLPELEATRDCHQGPEHSLDVFRHSMLAYRQLESILNTPGTFFGSLAGEVHAAVPPSDRPLLKTAVLLHDIGKPATRMASGGRVSFHGHAEQGARLVSDVCRRLRLSRSEAAFLDRIVARHLWPLHLYSDWARERLTERAVFRFFRSNGDLTPHLILHAAADHLAKAPGSREPESSPVPFLGRLFRDYVHRFRSAARPALPVDGHDLTRHFTLAPSPLVGRLLRHLEALHYAEGFRDRGEAMAAAGRWLEENRGDASEGGARAGGRGGATRDS